MNGSLFVFFCFFFLFLGVMIGVFWKREWRLIYWHQRVKSSLFTLWHQRRLSTLQLFSCLPINSLWQDLWWTEALIYETHPSLFHCSCVILRRETWGQSTGHVKTRHLEMWTLLDHHAKPRHARRLLVPTGREREIASSYTRTRERHADDEAAVTELQMVCIAPYSARHNRGTLVRIKPSSWKALARVSRVTPRSRIIGQVP